MKIKDGRIINSNKKEDILFRSRLKEVLKKYLFLNLSDIPDFIEELGEKSKEYQLESVYENNTSFTFSVKTSEKESFKVNILKANPEAYRICRVIKDGKEVTYSVRKGIILNE